MYFKFLTMKKFCILNLFCLTTFFCSCKSLKPATNIVHQPIQNYKYYYIYPTNSLTSSNGDLISVTKSVNPSDVINGMLSKDGFIRIPELKPELMSQTMIVNYGESGRRKTGLGGYTMEVTVQFINAKTNELLSSCTAEGQGATEADDIREAITRCLNSFKNTNSK